MLFRRIVLLQRFPALCFLSFNFASTSAQDRSNCTRDQGETPSSSPTASRRFSRNPVHLTVSSLPPGNGMALGVVFDQQRHYLTTFAPPQDSVFDPDPTKRQGKFESRASLGMVDASLAFVGSTNLSWAATGSLSWLPATYRPGQKVDIHGVTHDFAAHIRLAPCVHGWFSHCISRARTSNWIRCHSMGSDPSLPR